MRKLTLILIGLAIVAMGGALAFHAMNQDQQWSTTSAAAREAFLQGLEAEKKLYYNEAREHFTRALELDPDFVIARFKVLTYSPRTPDRAQRIQEFVDQTDLEQLSAHEQFLLQHRLAMATRDIENADRLIEEFLQKHPEDLHALTLQCDRLWGTNRLNEAEGCFERMLQLDANWVFAHNNLGYIRMARGEFERAEEAFAAYRRIAPDQANPHDSLGELYMLTGRYDEAKREFERAVEIRSDFCASWSHLIDLALLQGRMEDAGTLLARAESAVCSPEFLQSQKCRLAVWTGVAESSPALTVSLGEEHDCRETEIDALSSSLLFEAALSSGSNDLALEIEKDLAKILETYKGAIVPRALDRHIEGMRLSREGKVAEALSRFGEADELLTYNGDGMGIFKMYNRLVLATVLERSGAVSEANRLREEVRAVNAAFADRFGRPMFGA